MIPSAKRKDHPLSMRLPEGDIAIIDRAADLRGRSRTDFVREAAVRAAEAPPICAAARGRILCVRLRCGQPRKCLWKARWCV
ncbi:MAG: hypothetical protein B7Z75_14715 [Acidocella sp. 20-57-95]|nr:MAG: hypothetical protein B7Z75_14715 [Acidocella sp. 20-57-95]